MRCRGFISSISVAALLLVLAAAHGDDAPSTNMTIGSAAEGDGSIHWPDDWPESYSRHGDGAWMMAHIALMSIAWAVVLPVGEYQQPYS